MLIKMIVELLSRTELTPAELRNLQALLEVKQHQEGISFDPSWMYLEQLIEDRLAGK